MDRLKGKVAIVTGSTSGIGVGIAQLFAAEGAKVVVCGRREAKGQAVVDSITKEGGEASYHFMDITAVESIDALLKDTAEKYGKIDILVNNAGITRDAMTRKMTDEQWDLVVDVDLKGVFNLTRYVGPMMEELGGGSIINIASVVGEYGNIGQANYAASKAGVIGLSKTWAKEFARKGVPVRCNAIAPGYIMTDMMKTVPEDLLKKFAGLTMLGRLGQPEEIAKAALFLASDDASYVTGHVLSVNGGMRL